jgi:outer membrane biosynthesis protein TonB
MLLKLLTVFVALYAMASAQTAPAPNSDKSSSDPTAKIVCPKAANALTAAGQSKVVVQAVVNSAGKVESFNIVSPKGLRLEKDPEVRNTFKSLHFKPARKDGQPVMVLVDMDIDCSDKP